MTFILDMGSGNTCKNDINYMGKMVDAIAEIDPKRKIILKWQLFRKAGDNTPLDRTNFEIMYHYSKELGYKTTASVFDKESLDFLLKFDIPFVKIAKRPDLYWLIGEVPRKIPVIVSYNPTDVGFAKDENGFSNNFMFKDKDICCISKYPCDITDYEKDFCKYDLQYGISDHTTDWNLFREYRPEEVYECHFKLKDSTGPDAGDFARTPEQIKEIYEEIN